MKWSFKDPAVVEKTMKEFGVTDIQRKYKEINEHSAEWAKEWLQGSKDPQKLRKIGEKFKKDIKELDGYIKTFEKKYIEDNKLPVDERRIYNITNQIDDIENHDVISIPEQDGSKKRCRAINGKNWEEHKRLFTEEYERQLITAELMAVKKDKSIKLPPELKNKIDNYIGVTNAHFDLDDKHKEYKGNLFDTDSITGIRRLMDIREEAAKTPDDKGAKMIIRLADSHLKDPANAGLVEKANEINRKYAETAKKVADLTNEVHRDGLKNGVRLTNIYIDKKLGGTGTLRFYRSTVATMQYFNKDSDEEVLNGIRTLMNDPAKAAPETKKKWLVSLKSFSRALWNSTTRNVNTRATRNCGQIRSTRILAS